MNLRQLEYFVGIVEAGNMTRAAERLNVAQTALSMQMRLLEEELGVSLLVRHSRGVAPTPAGEQLHKRALQIIGLVDTTIAEIKPGNGLELEARTLGTTPALMPLVGPELALNVREHAPRLMLALIEGMSHVLVEQLIADELDFVLCYDVVDAPAITRTALLQDELVLVTQPRGLNDKPVPLREALQETLAMPEHGDSVRTAVTKAAGDIGEALNVAYEMRSIAAMKAMAARCAAACILPYASVLDEVARAALDARPITQPAVRRTLFLASSKAKAPNPSDAGLTSAVRASLAPLIAALGNRCQPL